MSESEDNRESVVPEAKSVKPTPCSSSREDFDSNIQKYVADWDKIQSALEEELDPQVYQAYIRPLRFVTYQKHSKLLSLEAPSRFVRQHVDSHFGKQLEKKCDSLFGPSVSIEYTVSTERSAASSERSAADGSSFSDGGTSGSSYVRDRSSDHPPLEEETYRDDSSSIGSSSNGLLVVKKVKSKTSLSSGASKGPTEETGLISRYVFDNFVVGSGNQFCHAASMHVAEDPGAAYNPLFIYGGVGLGKTHLLHAIGNAVRSAFPKLKVRYISSETFTNELILSLRYAKMDEFKNRYRNIDVLLIDDIQFMCGKERTQEEFFHTFNALYSAKHQIVITSDKLPQEIPGIEERLQTRFAWGLTADIQAPDFETRVAILNRKASLDRFDLPADVAHFIAENVSSNVRELEGALTRLHALCSLQKVEITLELAESALKPLLKKKKVHVTIEEIQKVVASHFSIKVSEMISKRRTKNLSFPRHVAMYLCRKHTTSSYPEIGAKFGGRDHSSVIHAANVVTTKVKDSKDVRGHIQEIEAKLLE